MSLEKLPDVIFDLGGVLLRWDPEAIVAAAIPDPHLRPAIRGAVFEHPDWLELDRGTLEEEEAVARAAARCGQSPDLIQRLMDEVPRSLTPQAETVDLLAELDAAGVPLYCLSNMHARQADELPRRYAFFERFRDVIFSCHVGFIKPEPEIYAHASTRFGLSPASCVFVDDAPANVEGAAHAGWHAVRFCEAAQCRAELLALARRWPE